MGILLYRDPGPFMYGFRPNVTERSPMVIVSVVIPTYNDVDTLPRAIDSVLHQTVSDIEIIVVDDDSPDDTRSVIEVYDDERIKLVRHERNRGGSAARNTGLEHASGKYVAYLDADDEWLPKKLERQLEELKSRSDEWVAAHCERVVETGLRQRLGFALSRLVGTKKRNPPREGGEELVKEVLTLNLSTGCSTLLIERETVEAIGGFDPAFPRHQDWEFLIRVVQAGKLVHVDKPLVIKHDTASPGVEATRRGKELLLEKFDDEIEMLESRGHEITRIHRNQLATLYIDDGQFRRGLEHLEITDMTPRELMRLLWYVPGGLTARLSRG